MKAKQLLLNLTVPVGGRKDGLIVSTDLCWPVNINDDASFCYCPWCFNRSESFDIFSNSLHEAAVSFMLVPESHFEGCPWRMAYEYLRDKGLL